MRPGSFPAPDSLIVTEPPPTPSDPPEPTIPSALTNPQTAGWKPRARMSESGSSGLSGPIQVPVIEVLSKASP
jgi:hypothetical protein